MSNITTRIAKWDNAKAILIFLVVFGHSISPFISDSEVMRCVYVWLTTFHMPLFMFITGLFSKSFANAPKLNVKKIVSYILLFYYMKLLIYATVIIFRGHGKFRVFTENGTPWYIFVTAVFMVLAFCLKKVSPKIVLPVSFVLALAVGYIDFVGDFLMLSRIFVFFPYFYLGYALDRNKVLEFTDKKSIKIVSVVIIVVFTVAIFTLRDNIYGVRYSLTGNNPYSEFGRFSNLGILIRVVSYILSSVVSLAVLSIIPKKNIPVVTRVGSKTLTIYAVHRPVQYAFNYTLLPLVTPILPQWAVLPSFFILSAGLTLLLSLKPFDYIVYPCTKWDKWCGAIVKLFKK